MGPDLFMSMVVLMLTTAGFIFSANFAIVSLVMATSPPAFFSAAWVQKDPSAAPLKHTPRKKSRAKMTRKLDFSWRELFIF